MKHDTNPMYAANSAPRCAATSKRSGLPCKAPAVRGWAVCRFHGARGGHGPGKDHPQYQHGGRSSDTEEIRRLVTALAREARDHLGDMKSSEQPDYEKPDR